METVKLGEVSPKERIQVNVPINKSKVLKNVKPGCGCQGYKIDKNNGVVTVFWKSGTADPRFDKTEEFKMVTMNYEDGSSELYRYEYQITKK